MAVTLKLLRPAQWLKNLMLFFPPFLAGKFFAVDGVQALAAPFVAFSLFSSSCYIVNDVFDLKADRNHPKKCYRPLPAGKITVRQALILALLLAVCSLLLSWLSVPDLMLWLISYFILSLAYTLWFKHLPWIDLVMIAFFFLLRLHAGGVVYHVNVTLWLYLSVFLLAIFLAAGKRLSEITQLGDNAASHRQTLMHYSRNQLLRIVKLTAVASLLTYTMYCISHHALIASIPVCAYGLYRYVRRVQQGRDGDPTTALLKDPQLLTIGVIWCVMVFSALY